MSEIYLQAAVGESNPRRSDGAGGDIGHQSADLAVGLLFPLSWGGAVTGEVAYNRLWGPEQTLGSYRQLLGARVGYRQSILRYGFLGAKAGTGANFSHLNFGTGRVPLPDDVGLPLQLSLQAGGQYCFGRHPCAEAFVSPFYERGLAGAPAYTDKGVLFGVGVRFDIGRTVPYEEHEKLIRRNGELESALARAGGERPPPEVAVCPEVSPAVEPPPCPESPPPPPCPVCPPPPPPPPERGILAIVSENPLRIPIIFTNESPQLSEREERVRRVRIDLSDPWLDRVADYLKSHSNVGVRIQGHANDTGPEDQNVAISEQRARAVARYLRRHGVPAGQILPVVGHGSSSPPVESNPADPLNRSVVFEEVALP